MRTLTIITRSTLDPVVAAIHGEFWYCIEDNGTRHTFDTEEEALAFRDGYLAAQEVAHPLTLE